jgi:hypothetical protein
MRYIVALLTLLVVGHRAEAATFSDTFASNPFIPGLARWCERWHHIHWDSINLLMSGVNGTSCAGFSCCAQCGTPGNGCSETNINGFFLITTANYGGNTRSAKTDFAVQTNLVGSDHVSVFSVAHPNCHAGAQADIARHAEGDYYLFIQHTDNADGVHGECGVIGDRTSAEQRNLNLVLSTLPRYRLTLTTARGNPITNITSTATLVDIQTGATLATVSLTSPKPQWYNNQAQRFGLGSAIANTSFTIPHDNFVGTFQ